MLNAEKTLFQGKAGATSQQIADWIISVSG